MATSNPIPERLHLRNNQDILCIEGLGIKVKRDAKNFGVMCAENGVEYFLGG